MACADDCHGEIPVERPSLWKSRPVRASLLSWVFVASAFVASAAAAPGPLVTACWAAAIVAGAFYFSREALEELREEREIGIELLMTVAIVGAVVLGNWREAALVASLFSITEALEGFTIQRTRFAIRGLMDLVPPRAHVVTESGEADVDVKEVRPGDMIRVRPGESIPVDGVIREGVSAIDEAAVTGESLPVEREQGDAVFAGTVNGNGVLLLRATKSFEDNVVNKIIALVERAQAQKSRSQLMVERFARVYSPSVLGIAVLLAIVPGALGYEGWWVRAVAFLVAASPCALAVATPVTLVAAIGAAARRGILVKGGIVLEDLGRVRAVALDKTGTLTFGRPEVTSVHVVEGDEAGLLRLAGAVERHSEHPLGRAIVREAWDRRHLAPADATDVKALTATGIEGTVEGSRVSVLKPSAVRERVAVPGRSDEWLRASETSGASVVAVLQGSRLLGFIALADTLRPESKTLVRELHRAGVEHVVMLTGDNAGTAAVIAKEAGIDEFHAGVLPEDKVRHVERLREKYGRVAMIGDGINDAPALAAANVGIAMGTGGSDAAIAAADVALVSDDLSTLQHAFALGKRTRRIILQNLAVSMVIVLFLVAGTIGARLTMFEAVLGHEGSEVLIILNGLRVALRSGM